MKLLHSLYDKNYSVEEFCLCEIISIKKLIVLTPFVEENNAFGGFILCTTPLKSQLTEIEVLFKEIKKKKLRGIYKKFPS